MPKNGTVENRLCELFGFADVVLFGRARSGLVALLEILGGPGSDLPVLIPSNICPAIIASIVAASARPRLVSVSAKSGLASDAGFAEAIRQESHQGLVMPTHLYGLRDDYPETRRVAAQAGWFVLENDTLASARVRENRRIAFGDALLVSFGDSKTIECTCGGAILTDNTALCRQLADRAAAWPPINDEALRLEHDLTLIRRYLRQSGRPELSEALLSLDAQYTRHSFPAANRSHLESCFDHLPRLLDGRWNRMRLWENALAPFADELLAPPQEPTTPWRLVRRLRRPEVRNHIVAALRLASIDVGTNYPPLNETFPKLLSAEPFPEAAEWGCGVINLWLTDNVDFGVVETAAKVIERSLRAAGQS